LVVRLTSRTALRAVGALLVVASGWVLWRQFHELPPGALRAALAGLTPRQWGEAAAGTVLGFAVNGLVEWRALRWVGARTPFWTTQKVAFAAGSLSHCLGANLLVAGLIRGRLYDRWGVGAEQVTAATLFQGGAFALGLTGLASWGLLTGPDRGGQILGGALLAAICGYFGLCALRAPLPAWGRRRLSLPSLGDALAQGFLGALDTAISVAILWRLLPEGAIAYLRFVPTYAGGYLVGLFSGSPGGLGVFEAAVLALDPGIAPAALAAGFLAYRLVFYLAPLALGAAILAFDVLGPGAVDAPAASGPPRRFWARPKPLE
jgi:uncharacterized membrane protein YbhN (UPF0104 family)